jgi:hypothetical protein
MIDPNLIFRLSEAAMAVEQFLREEYDTDFTFPQAVRFAQFTEILAATASPENE